MLITKIEPKNILGKTANVVFTNIIRYDLHDDECVLRYELKYRDPNRESPAAQDSLISFGEWKVPTDVLNAWSGSNHYLAEKMCESFDMTVIKQMIHSENV
jgi:hypothetical protein